MDDQRHAEINRQKWDRWADTLDGNGWKYKYLRNAQASVIAMLDLREGMSLLDIGCGTGWGLDRAAQLLNDRGEFYGIDLSGKMIAKASRNFESRQSFHFLVSNAESIPLHDLMFDRIICTNSFHHYRHPDAALREMHRLLKQSGMVLILDPTADGWFLKGLDRVIRLFDRGHVKMYSTEEFRQMFASAGLAYAERVMVLHHQVVHVAVKAPGTEYHDNQA